MKAYGAVGVQLHSFLASALEWGKWFNTNPNPIERTPNKHWRGGWQGQTLYSGEEKISLFSVKNRAPFCLVHSLLNALIMLTQTVQSTACKLFWQCHFRLSSPQSTKSTDYTTSDYPVHSLLTLLITLPILSSPQLANCTDNATQTVQSTACQLYW